MTRTNGRWWKLDFLKVASSSLPCCPGRGLTLFWRTSQRLPCMELWAHGARLGAGRRRAWETAGEASVWGNARYRGRIYTSLIKEFQIRGNPHRDRFHLEGFMKALNLGLGFWNTSALYLEERNRKALWTGRGQGVEWQHQWRVLTAYHMQEVAPSGLYY